MQDSGYLWEKGVGSVNEEGYTGNLNSWLARRSNQSILKEINPEYSLEELMLKLKL